MAEGTRGGNMQAKQNSSIDFTPTNCMGIFAIALLNKIL